MLPDIYRKLEYIENTAPGSYIDTGLLASTNLKAVVDGYVIDGDTAFLGERSSMNASDAFTLQFTGEQHYRFTYNANKIMAPVSYVKGIRHVFTCDKDGFYIDDDYIGAPSKKTVSTQHSIYMIGAMNTAGAAASFGIVRIYSVRFYDGEELIRDYIPCVSKEGVYGVYEDVSGEFLSNAGTEDFTGVMEPFTGIMLTSLPDKKIYEKGGEFDATGLVVEAFCESGYHEEITSYTLSGYDPETPGIQTITVEFNGLTDEFSIFVQEAPVPQTFITLEEMKQYLRVDFEDDDALIESLITSSEKHCMDIARIDDKEEYEQVEDAKTAVMYTVAFLYEHRENANLRDLNLQLRALLFGSRKEVF